MKSRKESTEKQIVINNVLHQIEAKMQSHTFTVNDGFALHDLIIRKETRDLIIKKEKQENLNHNEYTRIYKQTIDYLVARYADEANSYIRMNIEAPDRIRHYYDDRVNTVNHSIMHTKDKLKQTQIFEYWIRLANKCLVSNPPDIFSASAIMNALNYPAVSKLLQTKETQNALSDVAKKEWLNLQGFMKTRPQIFTIEALIDAQFKAMQKEKKQNAVNKQDIPMVKELDQPIISKEEVKKVNKLKEPENEKARKLWFVINELYQTEKSFRDPIVAFYNALNTNKNLLPPEALAERGRLENFLATYKAIMDNKFLSDPQPDTMDACVNELRAMYGSSDFLTKNPIWRAAKEFNEFKQFLFETEHLYKDFYTKALADYQFNVKDNTKLFDALIITPVQRMPRYGLYLKQLVDEGKKYDAFIDTENEKEAELQMKKLREDYKNKVGMTEKTEEIVNQLFVEENNKIAKTDTNWEEVLQNTLATLIALKDSNAASNGFFKKNINNALSEAIESVRKMDYNIDAQSADSRKKALLSVIKDMEKNINVLARNSLSTFGKKITHMMSNIKSYEYMKEYNLMLMSEIAFKGTQEGHRGNDPILVKKDDGNYLLWGKKEDKWEAKTISQKHLPEVAKWNFSGSRKIKNTDPIFEKLSKGHTFPQIPDGHRSAEELTIKINQDMQQALVREATSFLHHPKQVEVSHTEEYAKQHDKQYTTTLHFEDIFKVYAAFCEQHPDIISSYDYPRAKHHDGSMTVKLEIKFPEYKDSQAFLNYLKEHHPNVSKNLREENSGEGSKEEPHNFHH